ncbi:MAG: peptide chain release factor N(5)-glutamine methyltransferase [Bacteroidales bacterium]
MNYSDINKVLKDALHHLFPDREIESIGRLVLEHLTGMSWVQIRLNHEKEFTPYEESQIGGIIARLKKHEPIQYILGETEFYGLKLKVRPGVLIPRGETEELVDWIIKAQVVETHNHASLRELKPDEKEGLRVLDIGCGSGAIAIALAKYLFHAEVVASDISQEALELTNENAALNGLTVETHNYASLQTFLFDILAPQLPVIPAQAAPAFAGVTSAPVSYDVIVSNPPYVPIGEMTSMDLHVVEYEPKTALFVPDHDPLLFYRAIAEFAASHLNPGGQVFVEIHDRLGEETADVFRKWFTNVELRKDIHGKDRMIRAQNG